MVFNRLWRVHNLGYIQVRVDNPMKIDHVIFPNCRSFSQDKMELYHLDGSGPARACRLTAALLDLPLNLKVVNLLEKEQLQDWFIQVSSIRTAGTRDKYHMIFSG